MFLLQLAFSGLINNIIDPGQDTKEPITQSADTGDIEEETKSSINLNNGKTENTLPTVDI